MPELGLLYILSSSDPLCGKKDRRHGQAQFLRDDNRTVVSEQEQQKGGGVGGQRHKMQCEEPGSSFSGVGLILLNLRRQDVSFHPELDKVPVLLNLTDEIKRSLAGEPLHIRLYNSFILVSLRLNRNQPFVTNILYGYDKLNVASPVRAT